MHLQRVAWADADALIGGDANGHADDANGAATVLSGLARNENVKAGKDADRLVIDGDLAGGNNIHMEKGDDVLDIRGAIGGFVHAHGGPGADILKLPKAFDAYEIHNLVETQGRFHVQLTDTEAGGRLLVNHFEAVSFGDGHILGDTDLLPPRVAVYDVDIRLASGDRDGSEELGFSLSDLPDGASLTAGRPDADGVWQLELSDLADLQMLVPGPAPEDFTLRATATSHEVAAPEETATTSVEVTVVNGRGGAGYVEESADMAGEPMAALSIEDLAAAQAQAPMEPGAADHGAAGATLALQDIADLILASAHIPDVTMVPFDMPALDHGAFDGTVDVASLQVGQDAVI